MGGKGLTIQEGENIMGLDHSNAFVRLSFDGLIGFCFCRREDYSCQMGMVQVPDHEPLISVDRIYPNGTRYQILNNYPLTAANNISLEVRDPVRAESTTYPESFAGQFFDRLSDSGDPEDFRWIMNLQGEDFHGEHLRLKRGGSGDTLLRPKITIPSAIFYTLEKTPTSFRRFRNLEDPRPRPIGKIADQVGADILCRPDPDDHGQKLVTLKIAGHDDRLLYRNIDQGRGFRYAIKITNLCRRVGTGEPLCGDQSDFPYYYKVAQDDDDIKYDLGTMHAPGDPYGRTLIEQFNESYYPEFVGFKSDGPPQVCSVGFFGLANKIP
jgi:hypothetical protein